MVNWPAVVQFDNQDELSYVPSLAAWQSGLAAFSFSPKDRLIDCTGTQFSLSQQEQKLTVPTPLPSPISLTHFIDVVRKHAASLEQCCVSKLYFESFEEGFAMIQALE